MEERALLKLKQEIDSAKQEKSTLSGELNALKRQLKTDFDCSSVEDAEKLLQDLRNQQQDLNKKIQQAIIEIEEKYDHD